MDLESRGRSPRDDASRRDPPGDGRDPRMPRSSGPPTRSRKWWTRLDASARARPLRSAQPGCWIPEQGRRRPARSVREQASLSKRSREEEARLAYQAVRTGLGPIDGSVVVFDTGGGSSQFTFGEGPEGARALQRRRGSRPLYGAVRSRSEGHARRCRRRSARLRIFRSSTSTRRRTRSSGWRGRHEHDRGDVAARDVRSRPSPGCDLDRGEVDRIELYRSLDADARREIVGLQPKRAERSSPAPASFARSWRNQRGAPDRQRSRRAHGPRASVRHLAHRSTASEVERTTDGSNLGADAAV